MDLREPPVLPQQPELSTWLFELRSLLVSELEDLSDSIDDLEDVAIEQWFANGEPGTLVAGMPAYISAANTLTRADGSDSAKECDGYCIATSEDGSRAKLRRVGYVEDVPVETGASISAGQVVYLSITEVATVVRPAPKPATGGVTQVTGLAINDASGGLVDIIGFVQTPGRRRR